MKKALLALLVGLVIIAFAQTPIGPRAPASGTYANRPSAAATGTVYIVTNASVAGTCDGSGSAVTQCRYNGSAWVGIGGGGTGPTGPTGAQGSTGPTGPSGPTGASPGFPYLFTFNTATPTCTCTQNGSACGGGVACVASATAGSINAVTYPGITVTHNYGLGTTAPMISGADSSGISWGTGTTPGIVANTATSTNVALILFASAANGTILMSAGGSGIQGPTGAVGPSGPTGPSGAAGATGPTGPQGPTGASGGGTGTISPGSSGQIPEYSASTTVGPMTTSLTAQTDGSTVTWAIASHTIANASLLFTTHGGNRTLNITGPVAGGNYILRVTQDSTGGEGLILGTGCTWKVAGGGAGAITTSTGASAIDVLAFIYDGANCLATFTKNFN